MFAPHTFHSPELRWNGMLGPAHGPHLVLLHGVIRRWQTFHPLLPHLHPRWQLCGVDLPGHGSSARSAGGYLVRDYAQAVTELLRAEFSQPLVIYGHSLGAMLALGAARELGERVRAVVLEDPPLDTMGVRIHDTPLHGYFAGLQRWAGTSRPRDEVARELADFTYTVPSTGTQVRLGDQRDAAQLRFLASCLAQLDPRVLTPIVERRWLDGFDWRAAFRELRCPALLLQADPTVGGMLTDADAREAEALSPLVTRVALSQCGHNMHWTRTQDVANLACTFLESL